MTSNIVRGNSPRAFQRSTWKAGRQCTTGHDVLRPDDLGVRAEINEISRPDVHCADAEAKVPGVQTIEIHQALQRALEGTGIEEACRLCGSGRLQPWRERARREEAIRSSCQSQVSAGHVHEIAHVVAVRRSEFEPWPGRTRGDLRPKLPQPIDP